ncbi:MAG: single-stranded-DNA-specific exonuclease RecJ [Pseudomonadota bacterium]
MSVKPIAHRDVPAHQLAEVDPVLARLLASRGVKDASQADLSLRQLSPIGALGGLDAAVRLLMAHRTGRVLIVGDFDADGATSTALVTRCLAKFGFPAVDSLVPNRFDFGYGLTAPLVEIAKASEPSLIVTVDNGISSVKGVRAAREAGIDVLITDHHLPPEQLPDANVIVNPNMPDDAYPSKSLAGVGVAFCVMVALARELAKEQPDLAKVPANYLDLVALGTVADVVPLDHNNRVLVQAGLERIRARRCVPGILALLEAAGRDPAEIVATDLGFAVAPRLNAAGRLTDMSVGIRCLSTDSPEAARETAAALDGINRERRHLQNEMQKDADASIETLRIDNGEMPACVCLYESHWHQGIVGLIASRIKDTVNRPVFAFAKESDGLLKGSGRSIRGVHLRDLLAEVSHRLPGAITKFGGHAMAAGLTLRKDALVAFRGAVVDAMRRLYPAADFNPAIVCDGELPASHLSLQFAEKLRAWMPWGQQFPEPIFVGRFTAQTARLVGESHVKFVFDHDGQPIDGIAFGQRRPTLPAAGQRVEVCYRLDVNVWRQRRMLQLMIEQWQVVDD